MQAGGPLPLAGIRVVDLTSNIAAPFAGAILADLGADVVHVESPEGDDSRRMAPTVDDESAYFRVVNRGKEFARLDLRTASGRDDLMRMLDDADVFLCNLRPAKLSAYGLDAATLTATRPRLVHGSLTSYGAAGADRDRAGYDGVLQARTGIASVTGTPDGPPVRAGVSILDMGSGTWLALGVLAALYRRERTGAGGAIATSLFETGANWVAYHVVAEQVTGARSSRHGSGHPAFAPYGIFAAGDADVFLGIGGDAIFARLCEALEAPHLLVDGRYLTNVDRVRHDAELRLDLQGVMSAMTATEVVDRLAAAGVAADVVQVPEDLLRDPQAVANGVLQPLWSHDGEVIVVPGLPLTIDGARPPIRQR